MVADGSTDSGARGDGRRVHFEETVSTSVGDVPTVKLVAVAVGLLVFLSVVGLVASASSGAADAWVAIALAMVLGLVAFAALSFLQSVAVTVDGDGVEVRREGPMTALAGDAEIPFEDVTEVEYDDRDEGHVYVRSGDRRAQTFLVSANQRMGRRNATVNVAANAYRNGVRIERADGPAVYVGSDRPVELAETIAERAPDVERAEELPA